MEPKITNPLARIMLRRVRPNWSRVPSFPPRCWSPPCRVLVWRNCVTNIQVVLAKPVTHHAEASW